MRFRLSHRAKRTTKRALAVALATLALAGQLGGFAHLVLVRHVSCAEHGESIDVGMQRFDIAASDVAAASSVGASARARELHGHDHCMLSPLRRDRLSPINASCAGVAPVQYASLLPDSGIAAAAPQITILRLAPKNSPPV